MRFDAGVLIVVVSTNRRQREYSNQVDSVTHLFIFFSKMQTKKPHNKTHFVVEEHIWWKIKTLSLWEVRQKDVLNTAKKLVNNIKQLEKRMIVVTKFTYNKKTGRKQKKYLYSKTVHTFENLLTLFWLYMK